MSGRVWGIKLGSGGRCVPFCERNSIVGIGWKDVDPEAVAHGDRDKIYNALKKVSDYRGSEGSFGQWTGALHRFGRECAVGDYILYYDPAQKSVRICRVTSGVAYRHFDLHFKDLRGEEIDIWHYRKVEFANEPIPILDFYGALKGKLLGPRGTFWELRDTFEIVDQIARGLAPNLLAASDPEIKQAFAHLRALVVARAEALNERDWEDLVADYFVAQGAHVDLGSVGGSRGTIDVEATFTHGELPESLWRIQVKRLQNQQVDWPAIETDLVNVGEAQFCYVSVFGFTPEARSAAAERGILLLEAGDFTGFLLSGRVRDTISRKLLLPSLGVNLSAAMTAGS
jgi:hypothetical protein